jgi:hypothetical protein
MQKFSCQELHNTGNTSGAANKNDFVDLVDLGVPENLLNGLEGVAGLVTAQLLETSRVRMDMKSKHL